MRDLDQAREHHRRGNLSSAISFYSKAMRDSQNDASALHDYGVALLQSRQTTDALKVLKQALDISPDNFAIFLALSQTFQLLGRIEEALTYSKSATDIQPGNPQGWFLRGRLETVTGASAEAEKSLAKALSIDPSWDEAWHYLGECLQQQGRWDAAEKAYRNAMRSQPSEIMNVGICSELAGKWLSARDSYQNMCALHPKRYDSLVRLAQASAMLCDHEAESSAIQRLCARMSEHPSHQSALSNDYPEPFALSYLPIPAGQRRELIQHYARRIESRTPHRFPPHTNDERDTIRVGYISSDFGQHAISTLLNGFFAAHDRRRFQVHGYSTRRHDSSIGHVLSSEFDAFHDLEGASFIEVATQIHRDQVDVLIDLGGYTRGSRQEILAMRPAPVQLGWLGFIHGHEASWLDGLILDDYIQPEGGDWPFSDKVFRLPGTVFPCGSMPSGTADRARFGLPASVPILASFNNSYKLDSELIDAWIEIFKRAMSAHLAIYLPLEARAFFLDTWVKRGGDPSRLHFLDHLPMIAQADRAASCDLFLDAFRYQAGATAMASVAAGLPILSRSGSSPLARLSAGINHFLGMDELICGDTRQYIERAVELANDQPRMHSLRSRLQQSVLSKGLCDPRRTASAIESLIEIQTRARQRQKMPEQP